VFQLGQLVLVTDRSFPGFPQFDFQQVQLQSNNSEQDWATVQYWLVQTMNYLPLLSPEKLSLSKQLTAIC